MRRGTIFDAVLIADAGHIYIHEGETPNGAERQEAHRTPRGKRATWNGNQLHSKTTKFAKTALLAFILEA
jgi:hypothetical protein